MALRNKTCPKPGCWRLQPCSQHPKTYKRTPEKQRLYRARYGTADYKRFKQAVEKRSGGKCEAVKAGRRCNSVDRCEPHHIVPLEDGGSHDPRNGILLCLRDHRAADREARRKRRQRTC